MGHGGRAGDAVPWSVGTARGLAEGAPQADVPDAAGPNNALEPTAPMAACGSRTSHRRGGSPRALGARGAEEKPRSPRTRDAKGSRTR
jgi:hypothetical protein